jgi:putative N-acetylmannosamine-6-phosphate epimerase
MEQLKLMREKKRGVIGMKLIGEGRFVDPEEREKAIRFVMQSDVTDAVVIGFKSEAEIDEAIARINSALAVTA